MNRILRRPMFRMGGTPNEGIMTGLTKPKRMGYAKGSGLPGILMGPQETDFEQIDLFDPIAEQRNKLLRIQQKSQEGKFLTKEERDLATEFGIKSFPEIQKAKKTEEGYTPVDIANVGITSDLTPVKTEPNKEPKKEPKTTSTITADTRGSSKSDKDTIKDYMEMFKTALAGDEDSSRRQKYLELAKFGANLLAQPGGSLTAAIGKEAAPSLEGLSRIKEKEQDVETKAKLLGVEAALKKMDPTQLQETVDYLMKTVPGLSRKDALDMAISGSATKGRTREDRRARLADVIGGEGISPRQADIISEKIMISDVPNYKYTLLPEKPVEGEYYYDKKGNVGQYQIRDGKPGLFEKD